MMKEILIYKGGIGDALFVGTIALALAEKTDQKVLVHTYYPELFDHPKVKHLSRLQLKMYRYLGKFFPTKYRCNDLYYTRHYSDKRNTDIHFMKLMASMVGLEIDPIPQLAFPMGEPLELERSNGEIYIGVQSTGSDPRLANKFYYPERFEEVIKRVKAARPEVKFIQFGLEADPTLTGIDLDFRGKTSIRGAFQALMGIDLFVGLVGFLMHASAAVDLPSVIVFGGREKPAQSGYPQNVNIATDMECSPCWAYECPIDRECMKRIASEQVAKAVLDKLEKR